VDSTNKNNILCLLDQSTKHTSPTKHISQHQHE